MVRCSIAFSRRLGEPAYRDTPTRFRAESVEVGFNGGMTPDASVVGSRFLRELLALFVILGGVGLLGSEAHAAPPLVVETWNIRYDNPGDGIHAWPHRREGVVNHLRDSKADIIGLQEALPHLLAAVTSGLEGHGSFSRGRDRDAASGEAVPILWRRDRWRLDADHAGHFWLSETPEVPGSMSWNTACTRMVTMVRLLPVETSGDRGPIWVCNLHLDHQSAEARAKGAALVRERIASRPRAMRKEPIIILGDFNATPGSPPVETLLAAGEDVAFVDAWTAIEDRPEDAPRSTWNGWDADADGRRIDYILVRGLTVRAADIMRPTNDAGPLSDHWPVRATLDFTPDVESASE